MSVIIKHKNPSLVPICDVAAGSFFYYNGTLYMKVEPVTDEDGKNICGFYGGVPVGVTAYYVDPLCVNDKISTVDVLVQPVNVCIEIL